MAWGSGKASNATRKKAYEGSLAGVAYSGTDDMYVDTKTNQRYDKNSKEYQKYRQAQTDLESLGGTYDPGAGGYDWSAYNNLYNGGQVSGTPAPTPETPASESPVDPGAETPADSGTDSGTGIDSNVTSVTDPVTGTPVYTPVPTDVTGAIESMWNNIIGQTTKRWQDQQGALEQRANAQRIGSAANFSRSGLSSLGGAAAAAGAQGFNDYAQVVSDAYSNYGNEMTGLERSKANDMATAMVNYANDLFQQGKITAEELNRISEEARKKIEDTGAGAESTGGTTGTGSGTGGVGGTNPDTGAPIPGSDGTYNPDDIESSATSTTPNGSPRVSEADNPALYNQMAMLTGEIWSSDIVSDSYMTDLLNTMGLGLTDFNLMAENVFSDFVASQGRAPSKAELKATLADEMGAVMKGWNWGAQGYNEGAYSSDAQYDWLTFQGQYDQNLIDKYNWNEYGDVSGYGENGLVGGALGGKSLGSQEIEQELGIPQGSVNLAYQAWQALGGQGQMDMGNMRGILGTLMDFQNYYGRAPSPKELANAVQGYLFSDSDTAVPGAGGSKFYGKDNWDRQIQPGNFGQSQVILTNKHNGQTYTISSMDQKVRDSRGNVVDIKIEDLLR